MAEAAPAGTPAPTSTEAPVAATPTTGSTDPIAGVTTDAAKEAMRKFKVKVDNQEMEVDESELIKGYTHGKAAAKRFQEGSHAKKQAEEFIQMMKDEGTLIDVIKKLGHDPRAISEKYLASIIQEELMDPKDRELKTYKEQVEEFKKQEAARQAEVQRQEHERLKIKYAKEYSDQFVEALKTSGLPQTKTMVAKMAEYVKKAAGIGYQLTAQDAAKLVKEDKAMEIKSLAGQFDGKILAEFLGEEGLKQLRAYETQRIKDPAAQLTTPTDQPTEIRKKVDNSSRMTPQEWRKFNRGY